MIKKTIISITSLIFGVLVAFILDSFLKDFIIEIYTWSTNDRIIFSGKNLTIFPPLLSLVSFGVSFLILSLDACNNSFTENRKIGAYWLLRFIFLIVLTSSIQAQFRIVECTACQFGIRHMSYNELQYGLTISIATLLSSILNLVRVIKKAYNTI